jgi:hypothetical protein
MPRVGFELTISVFERVKAVHALDSAATVIGFPFLWVPELSPASATSFSQQQFTTTEPQQFPNSLTTSVTRQPTQLD